MAGNYPDVPSWRIPYDRDGTEAFRSEDNVTYTNGGVSLSALNNESSDAGFSGFGGSDVDWMMMVFPRLMDIDAYMAQGFSWAHTSTMYWSPDTTTGTDGTWNVAASMSQMNNDNGSSLEDMRNNILGLALTGVRAIKISMRAGPGGEGWLRTLHLYGEPTAGEDTNKLQIIKSGLDERVAPAHFDFGDVPRNSTHVKQFRVKNLSTTATANDVVVSLEVPTDTTPSFDNMHEFSDGGSYLPQINIGNLAPGGISSNIDVRQIMDTNATLGLRWARILAVATSWS